MTNDHSLNRRHFLRAGAAGAGLAAATPAFGRGRDISLVLDPSDPLAAAPPVKIALLELEQALKAAHFTVHHSARAAKGTFSIVAAGGGAAAQPLLAGAGLAAPVAAESLVLLAAPDCVLACGADARGLAYGLYELADRVRHAPQSAFVFAKPVAERPANPVRSIMRQFVSEQYDKPWFYDRQMWPRYFAMLAAERFNRFDLAFGLGYDMLKDVADSYFLFLYPFVLSVPGYDVRATGVSDAERDHNLAALRYISEQAVAAGLDFELGIWMHGYAWPDSPHAQNTITGLDAGNHAAYCRDALGLLLRELPCVSSVGLRIHGESGVPEGSYGFWKTVFDGVKLSGRKVEMDLHAKGITKTMISDALATGMPVNIAPKFSAEHLGMPYHQAAIRELEMPVPGHEGTGLMTLSEGARSFTRYGYADLLKNERPYTVRYRVFSGTQRILMSADALTGAAYGRAFQFCGATGADLMEPLTCRGRRGSASSTPRSGYSAARLEPHWDWQKYLLWYRSFGRLLYNPDTDAQVFARPFGTAPRAQALQAGLAQASRILPIVTSAHLTSAACDVYWPECYWNQSMVTVPDPNPYADTPAPKIFQNVSPLDPQLFSGIADTAEDLLAGRGNAKYSTIEVASWLEDLSGGARRDLARAGAAQSVDFLRLAIDAHMQAGLGSFFAAKLRSGVLCALFDRTGDRAALLTALKLYRRARGYWAAVAARAHGVYGPDLSVSDRFSERGQWADRLALIDADIAALQKRLDGATNSHHPGIAGARAAALAHVPRRTQTARHTPPVNFHAGQAVALALVPDRKTASARLYYRHVDQAERYAHVEMAAQGEAWRAEIPAAYTQSAYPLQYYFELRGDAKNAWLYPGLGTDLLHQPYFVLQKA
jgi:hypothetical protein